MLGFGLGLRSTPVYHSSSGNKKGEYRSIEQQIRALEKFDGIWSHICYSQEMEKFLHEHFKALFFIRRDPRDIVVSMAHYYEKYPKASADMMLPNGRTMSGLKWDDRIKALIVYMGISLPGYGGWIRDGVYQVRYESMIDDRVTEFTRIQHYLEGLGLEPPSGGEMAEMSMVPHKLSFRRGRYGDWRDTFTSGHVEWADKYLGHVIRDWGYT